MENPPWVTIDGLDRMSLDDILDANDVLDAVTTARSSK